MSLRRRLALLSALAVAFAVLLASALVYTLVRDRLRGDIDNDLRHQADQAAQRLEEVQPLIGGAAGVSAGTMTASGVWTTVAVVVRVSCAGRVNRGAVSSSLMFTVTVNGEPAPVA